jgi:diguanylate cyclase (GGDEF)-like protein/PAS domain S-box-containing protein
LSSVRLLLLEPDRQAAHDLTVLLPAGAASDVDLDVVVVPSVEAAAKSRRDGVPACLVIPLLAAEKTDAAVVRDVRQALGDVPIIALVPAGGARRGLRAVRYGADDFVVRDAAAGGTLRHAVGCVVERVRYRVGEWSNETVSNDAAVLMALGQAVVVTDADGVVGLWNHAAELVYGWTSAEAVGQPVATVIRAEPDEPVAAIAAAIRRGESWTGELFVRRRDGAQICAFGTATPIFDDRGVLNSVVGLSVDITEEHARRDAQADLSAIVASSADAIFGKTLDGTIRSWNRGAAALYGYTEDQAVGQKVDMLVPSTAIDEVGRILRTVAAGETVRDLETVRRRRDGSLLHVSLTVSPSYDADGVVTGASVVGRDITDRKRLEAELLNQATHDALTGLPNRVLLGDRMTQAIAAATRRGTCLAILMLDVNQLAPVNARYGYQAGDRVLIEVAHRLRTSTGDALTVARLNGDKFVLVSEATATEAVNLAEAVAQSLEHAMHFDDLTLRISASIGIAVAPPVSAEPEALLGAAQAAVNAAKLGGRAHWALFNASDERLADERRQTGDDLAAALAAGTLDVHYQPVVQLGTGRLVGMEALARWFHPVRGWIPPSRFVPLAEDIGLVAELDAYVLERACTDAAKLRAWNVIPADGYVAVNVSARDVGDGGLVERVCGVAKRTGWPLSLLELEVTETALMGDSRGARTALETLRAMGIGVALDDFGTGYSSLTYLRQLPISTIKVDREFVEYMTSRSDDLAITASIVDLGRAVGVRTVAEGVETVEQLALLHRLGCDAAQGFLWSRAVSRDELASVVRDAPGGFRSAAPTPHSSWSGPRGTASVTNEHGLHRIRQLHREGASLMTIAAALNAGDFRTPTGQRWHGTSVARVIAYPPAMATSDHVTDHPGPGR